MKTYNKLVRDKIPQILTELNKVYAYHVASPQEWDIKLQEKLQEEVAEFLEEPSLEELADIQEVILALLDKHGWTEGELEKARVKKNENRGGFVQGYILDFSE